MTPAGLKEVVIFTDGAAEPNPGPGGYGVVLRYGKHAKELSAGFKLTTNNRMELLAAIVGLEALTSKCSVKLHSDSKYLVDSVNDGSVQKWRENDWYRTRKQKARNIDLWDRFLDALESHEVELIWVKGHAGIADNERCDYLAVEAAKADNLFTDSGYIAPDPKPAPSARSPVPRVPKPKKPGDPCRKCETPLIKRTPKKQRKSRAYHYEWYLYCTGCGTIYFLEEAKRYT